MDVKKPRERERVIEQATDWLLVSRNSDSGTAGDDFLAWLRASPTHVREYLGVASIAHDLPSACDDLGTLEELISRARLDRSDPFLIPSEPAPSRTLPSGRRWVALAAGLAAVGVLAVLSYSVWNDRPSESLTRSAAAPVSLVTRHGQLLQASLSDGSVLHLNTDSAADVSYSATERLVVLKSGQVSFKVAHDPQREFRVLANSAEVVAVGTAFDVRLNDGATAVTVVEGKVMVGLSAARHSGAAPATFVAVRANEQIRVAENGWPATPVAVDAERETAWLRHQIVFEDETLERVAAEMNRYSSIRIEIAPSLKSIQISGVFSTDSTDSFLVFLRSLDGVTVEVTPTRIVVAAEHRVGSSVR
jgi:transmembrane sensor